MEITILAIFCIALLICIFIKVDMLIALLFGFMLFFLYGLLKGFQYKAVGMMALNGVAKVKNMLFTFLLIGMLTASWRASGAIAEIINISAGFMRPSIFLLMVFWINSLVSFLTGTSFGTTATMGVISMTMGHAMGINPVFVAGAVLSGAFFGDRCSPVSTSALLVCELTNTNIYKNIRNMIMSAIVPFVLASLLYLGLGVIGGQVNGSVDIAGIFSQEFELKVILLLPAIAILVLALIKVQVKYAMMVSIFLAVLLCVFVQKNSVSEILVFLVMGYKANNVDVAKMLNGGGIVSMIRVGCIVCISSSFSGIFEGTHMLDGIKEKIENIGRKVPAYLCLLPVSVVACAVSCNQTLAIILTNQLCAGLISDREKRALALENGPVIIAPLIPWSIAGAVPISILGVNNISLLVAFYLYLIPLCAVVSAIVRDRELRKGHSTLETKENCKQA